MGSIGDAAEAVSAFSRNCSQTWRELKKLLADEGKPSMQRFVAAVQGVHTALDGLNKSIPKLVEQVERYNAMVEAQLEAEAAACERQGDPAPETLHDQQLAKVRAELDGDGHSTVETSHLDEEGG